MKTAASSIHLHSSRVLTLKSNLEKSRPLCYIILLFKVLIDKHDTVNQ